MEIPCCVLPSLLACLVLMTVLMPGHGQGSEESPLSERELQAALGSRMDNVQQRLADVTSSTEKMLSDVERAIYDCLGTHSELCEALEVEAGLADKMPLQSHWSPGKRLGKPASNAADFKRNSLYKELQRKRAVAEHLGGLFRGANNILREEKKRSCHLNLGFPCDTEKAMEMGELLSFLKTAKSPGKKRSVPMLKH